MDSSRRELFRKLCGLGSVSAFVSLTGCIGIADWETNTNADSSDDGTVGELSIPNPVIEDIVSPSMEIAESSRTRVDESDDEFHITVENTGSAGDGIIELYWVDDNDQRDGEVTEDEMDFQDSKEITLSEAEINDFMFEGEIPDSSDGFWFIVTSLSVSVAIKNNGGSGDVEVDLKDNGEIIDSTVVTMESDEFITIDLHGNGEQSTGNFDVTASPIE